MFIRLDENGYPYGLPIDDQNMLYLVGDIIKSSGLTHQMLKELGYAFYELTQPPEVGEYQVAEIDSYSWDGTIAYQTWKIRAMNDAERNHVDIVKLNAQQVEEYRRNEFKNSLLLSLQEDQSFREQLLALLMNSNNNNSPNNTPQPP